MEISQIILLICDSETREKYDGFPAKHIKRHARSNSKSFSLGGIEMLLSSKSQRLIEHNSNTNAMPNIPTDIVHIGLTNLLFARTCSKADTGPRRQDRCQPSRTWSSRTIMSASQGYHPSSSSSSSCIRSIKFLGQTKEYPKNKKNQDQKKP